MNLFFSMLILFCVGSMIGWIIELFYRRFVSTHKWINPGFLTGPCLPLYGFGVATLFLMSTKLNFNILIDNTIVSDILTILVMGISMTLIEFVAGIIFIKGMKIKLWDYSDRKFNIQGIICPTFSFIWLFIAALFYYLMKTPCQKFLNNIGENFVTKPALPFILGIFYGVLIIDFAISMNLSTKIRKIAKENKMVIIYEQLKVYIQEVNKKRKEKINYFLPFKSKISLKEHIENLLKSIKEKKK